MTPPNSERAETTMINGAVRVGASERQSQVKFFAIDPAKGAELPTAFSSAGPDDVADACAAAEAAFAGFSSLEPEARARFLEAIADNILGIGDKLIVTAMTETGLPRVRLEGERSRT